MFCMYYSTVSSSEPRSTSRSPCMVWNLRSEESLPNYVHATRLYGELIRREPLKESMYGVEEVRSEESIGDLGVQPAYFPHRYPHPIDIRRTDIAHQNSPIPEVPRRRGSARGGQCQHRRLLPSGLRSRWAGQQAADSPQGRNVTPFFVLPCGGLSVAKAFKAP